MTADVISARKAFFENMTPEAFKDLGADQLAYIKPVTVENRPGYAVYGANGSLLAVQNSAQMAQSLIFANEMAAATVH